MHELDAGRELDVAVAAIAGKGRGRQRQHGPQALAARRDQMVRHLGDHGYLGSRPRQDGGVDPLHIGRDEAAQRLEARFIRMLVLERNDYAHSRLVLLAASNALMMHANWHVA